ncbi:MAG: hypothetical protein Q4F97_03790 [Bacteroidales bacterium]|nr:hypothetical protein [Bacteroidales bacterium]
MNLLYIFLLTIFFICHSCQAEIESFTEKEICADIFPDYKDVTIPINIAPLNFTIKGELNNSKVVFQTKNKQLAINSKDGKITIPIKRWRELIDSSIIDDKRIMVSVFIENNSSWIKFKPFFLYISTDSIDPFIVYRLIEPGYESWGEMGIYQREIESFKEIPILENSSTGFGCMNCHSFCMNNQNKMLFHLREKCSGTIITDGKKIEKINTSTKETISPLVYPSWHPKGKFIAFSNNITRLTTLSNDSNRVEVYDSESDVVVYDVEKHEIITTPHLFRKDKLETFPTFSADGKKLYFCSSDTVKMPEHFKDAKYSLYSIDFNSDKATFGNIIDTLYNAYINKRSASFPRVSSNGKYLLYALSNYGNFSIWHNDSDLKLIDLKTNKDIDISLINSSQAESYHSWSSNSHWIMFNSRRNNGLYTNIYFAYLDDNGNVSKPFLLPQKNPEFYDKFMKSFNIPEFIKGKINIKPTELAEKANNEVTKKVNFRMITN